MGFTPRGTSEYSAGVAQSTGLPLPQEPREEGLGTDEMARMSPYRHGTPSSHNRRTRPAASWLPGVSYRKAHLCRRHTLPGGASSGTALLSIPFGARQSYRTFVAAQSSAQLEVPSGPSIILRTLVPRE